MIKKLINFIKDKQSDVGKKLLHDTLIMEGFVEITNGDIYIKSKNSVVDQGLIAIINYLALTNSSYYQAQGGSYGYGGMSPMFMVIGTNTSTGTTHSMTALTSPIGGSPGTKPNSQSGQTSNPSLGQWQVQWVATWNAGTVSGTLGEVGLYLDVNGTLQSFNAGSTGVGATLFSRMAAADGKFSSFSINTTVPLSVAWTFSLTYTT